MDPRTAKAEPVGRVESREIFGRYQITGRIAKGGMAEIDRAISCSIDGFQKVVALKRILPELSSDAEFVSMFIAEAKLAASLSHGNIVQVIDFGRVEQSYFIAMEYVEGRDLARILVKQSRAGRLVPIEVACYIIARILSGLEYAHTRCDSSGQSLGIVHRDVSPHNVLVSYDGDVKLTDFGIAKAKAQVALVQSGTVFGKFAYMSPEQARGEEVDARSDVFSAGIALYESLTARRLFFSRDPRKTLARVRNAKVPLASHYNPAITPELDAIVLRALSAERETRYGSCRELASTLEAHLHQLAPSFTQFHLAHFMKELFEDEVGPEHFMMAAPRPASHAPTARNRIPAQPTILDPVLTLLREKLSAQPSLWTVMELGAQLLRLQRPKHATRVYRVAACKFAQNGLLAQAVLALIEIRELEGLGDDLANEIRLLPWMVGQSNAAILERMHSLDLGGDDLGQILESVYHASGPSPIASVVTSPLFSKMSEIEFVDLVRILSVRHLAGNQTIIEEGERDGSLFIVARGRLVVYCVNFQGDKVYLSTASDGDCVGEFSFFTGEPRAASVETLEESTLFEIRQGDFDRILERFPRLTWALLEFYKERVVATLLAKSELFGVLPPKVRASLLEHFKLERAQPNELVVQEGEAEQSFYLIKTGELEVFTERAGYVFLSKLKSGDFFGEIAALTSRPRSASVRALGHCELLKLPGSALAQLAENQPEMMEVLRRRIARREVETAQRLTGGGLLV